jgi:hypothetical protein
MALHYLSTHLAPKTVVMWRLNDKRNPDKRLSICEVKNSGVFNVVEFQSDGHGVYDRERRNTSETWLGHLDTCVRIFFFFFLLLSTQSYLIFNT